VPGRFASGLVRLVLGGEEFERIDVENKFPGKRVIVALVGFRLTAAADQQFHPLGDVFLELLRSLTPHLGTDPIRELAFTDAPRGGDVDVEDRHFTSIEKLHAADISNYECFKHT
jgi:hypothetical protein